MAHVNSHSEDKYRDSQLDDHLEPLTSSLFQGAEPVFEFDIYARKNTKSMAAFAEWPKLDKDQEGTFVVRESEGFNNV